MNRNLCGVYFRIERDGKFENICFTDLTEEEQKEIVNNRDKFWLADLCLILSKTISGIGEKFDLMRD